MTSAINAHYDNISAVSYDQVWKSSQRLRFEAGKLDAAVDLSELLADIANRVVTDDAPSSILLFNSLSWQRGGVIEMNNSSSEIVSMPATRQRSDHETPAFFVGAVPPIGFTYAGSQQIYFGQVLPTCQSRGFSSPTHLFKVVEIN
jgi:hypothetical protein